MRYETALRLYDLGWIVGIIVFFVMRLVRENGYPEEIAFIIAFMVLGFARWMVEKMTAPKKKEESKKDDGKKEDGKDKKNEPNKENRHERKRF
jgi:hypothetical protein